LKDLIPMTEYYDWGTIHSPNNEVTIVVGARDTGKNYALKKHESKKQCTKDSHEDKCIKLVRLIDRS
jgi:hypothetical protein